MGHQLPSLPGPHLAQAPVSLISVSPQELELFRRRIRVTGSPPETRVPNLEAGDRDQRTPHRPIHLREGREEAHSGLSSPRSHRAPGLGTHPNTTPQ